MNMNMNITTKSAVIAALVLTCACGGGINLGRNDSAVKGDGDGGASTGGGSSSGSGGASTGGGSSSGSGGASPSGPSGGCVAPSTDLLTAALPVLSPGNEDYQCVRKTLTSDVYITGLRSTNSSDVYAITLGVGTPTAADGTVSCDAHTTGATTLFKFGAGVSDFAPPSGQALHLAAGQQLLFNVHRLDTSADPVTDSATTTLVSTTDGSPDSGELYVPTSAQSQDPALCATGTDLISASATINPGDETFGCTRKTLTADIDFTGISSNTVGSSFRLTVGAPSGPDGTVDCNAKPAGVTNGATVFGADDGTELVTLPSDESAHLASGQQLLLVWHALNTSVDVVTASADISIVSGSGASQALSNHGDTTDPEF